MDQLSYLSVCSGIEAATVAWPQMRPVAFSEIEPFPSAVLAHHYPNVPNLGDMTRYKEWDLEFDILVGGTPCQSFSVAGLRRGLDDPRGNLAIVYCGILERFRPRWFVWENVPGVLSSNRGRDFGSFLGAVAELGYGFAYRVLDGFFFGCAIPRPRVFVVGYFGDWRCAAAVLFERTSFKDSGKRSIGKTRPHTLSSQNAGSKNARGNIVCDNGMWRGMSVVETERALGFLDHYTNIKDKCPDGPRYKALGNSMAVPVMRWIGERICVLS